MGTLVWQISMESEKLVFDDGDDMVSILQESPIRIAVAANLALI